MASEIKRRIQAWAADMSVAYPFLAAEPDVGQPQPPSFHLTPTRLRASLRGLLLTMIRDGVGARSPGEVSEFVASVANVDMTKQRAQVDVPKIVDWLVEAGGEQGARRALPVSWRGRADYAVTVLRAVASMLPPTSPVIRELMHHAHELSLNRCHLSQARTSLALYEQSHKTTTDERAAFAIASEALDPSDTHKDPE